MGLGGTGPAPAQTTANGTGTFADNSYATAQLARLESAIMMLKPQIEAALESQARTDQNAQMAAREQPQSGSLRGSLAVNTSRGKQEDQDPQSPDSPLRTRRRMQNISIVAPHKEATGGGVVKDPVVKAPPNNEGRSQASASTDVRSSSPVVLAAVPGGQSPVEAARDTSKERSRPRTVNPVRVAPSAMDPESPRSPGKYSAWK